MAGIAFNIRKLLHKRDLSSTLSAFIYSGIISSGPWLFAVFALGVIASFGKTISDPALINTFMGIIIYIFALTTVVTYGSQMAITRFLSDCLYRKEDHRIPSLLVTSLLIIGGSAVILLAPWVWFLKLEPLHKLLTLYLLSLVACMWGVMIFVSTLKAYVQVSVAFLVGFGLAIPASLFIGKFYGLTGFLLGLNIGITIVVSMLCAIVLAEFSGKIKIDFELFSSFRRYPMLFFYGLIFGIGIWVDKFLVWFYHQVPVGAGLVGYPLYDGAMFIGYMTVLPALAYFILIAETDLYEIVRQYAYLINNHGNLSALNLIRKNLVKCLKDVFLRIGVFQGIFSVFMILTAPFWVQSLDLVSAQISILRMAILGAFFHMGLMLLTIVLTYINGEKDSLWIVFIFLLTNLLVTWLTLGHFSLYGTGYLSAALVGFVLGLFLVGFRLKHLHYFLICEPKI
jgi:polysaccharide biosynthesis protein PelG